MRPTTRACLLLLVAATFASGTALASTIYKWKDANGVTHSSDQPPPGQRYETRKINGGGYAVETPDAEEAPESAACASARKSLGAFDSSRPVQVDTDGDGKADRTLSDEERQSHRSVAEAAVKANCPGG
ncbi:hypothetical protein Psesu_2433 [Pseudoxanthomonas suwonensis 11-1]|uniref:DUF4124 domain-containing protein n=1 Tax=Pseudoxanthomonas suwonensis (strain 11-1) TaxID=743721 RepID=E6WW57_PSEUU|nr:DUF4124 domain-containing protein [Pseudoxanthomonas suwonensis]ADV28265.1 hypothetical protein Psesu_2433 [Pseudoxanthomonas suwonensis 11-1]